jgi:farnesyl diphosphate synthase
MAKSAALEKFESIFPTLVEDLLAHAKSYGLPQIALDWYKAVRKHPMCIRDIN